MTIIGGVSNIVLDYVFMVHIHMGVSGAALLATSIGSTHTSGIWFGVFSFKSEGVRVSGKTSVSWKGFVL